MPESDIHDLLLSTLRGDLPARAGGVFSLTAEQWRAVVALAADYQLAPLLYSKVRDLPAGTVPADVETGLKNAHRLTAAANMRLYHELRGMLRALAARSIPVIVLKGSYLAQAAYAHVALRPMRDIDLMVPRSRLPEALDCLWSLGYGGGTAEGGLAHCATAAHAAPLGKPGAPAGEMDWEIEGPRSPFAVDLDGLWDRARRVQIAGADTLVLSPEDFLLHLCLHGTRHLTRDWQDRTVLKSVCDIAHAVGAWGGELDWQTVRRRA